jgi:hypothetical protein
MKKNSGYKYSARIIIYHGVFKAPYFDRALNDEEKKLINGDKIAVPVV